MENSVAVKMNEDALYILIWKVFQDKNLSVKSKIKAEYIACYNLCLKNGELGFPGGIVDKNLPANAGDTGSITGPGRSYMLRSN